MSSVIHADNHIDALWRHFTSPRAEGLVDQLRAGSHDEALAILDVSEVEGGPFVGPEARFFTVRLEQQGRGRVVHIKAVDVMGAGCIATWRYPWASIAKVVREISRDEFERLTRVPS